MADLGSVVLGGAIALAGGSVTTYLQARLQRRAARVQYLWDKRAELYLDLLRHGSGQIAHMDDDGVDDQYGWAPGMEELRQDLTARVQLFGSPAVEERWRAASRADRQLDFYACENLLIMDGDQVAFRDDPDDAELARLKAEGSAARRALAEQARRGLGTDPLLKRSEA